MSTEQFSKLSIGENMVTTRAGAARAALSGSKSSSDANQDQPVPSVESPSPSPPIPALFISTKNLQYDVSGFGSNLRQRIKKGLEENEIKMKYCALSPDQALNGEKHFYIDDDITVSIGGELRRPTCTCGANEKGLACKHIYWLADQILSTAPEYLDEKPIQFSPDGSTIQSTTPVEILNNKGLEGVAGELNWILQKEDLPDDEESLRDEITKMLSVFEPQDALPGEFKTPPESPLTSERSRSYREFAKLVTDYTVRDPGLFLQLRDVIDPGFQRRVFFEKIDTRITRTFHALDEYIAHGPMNASPEAPRFDVPSCAGQLRDLVNAVDDFCREQDEDDPDARVIAVRAAAALIAILDGVVDHNVNSYVNNPPGLEAPSNPIENNLFVALIGSHTDGDSMFVLDTLRSLPQEDVLRNHWEILQGIEQKLAGADTPSNYEITFRNFVHDSRKRAASEVREGEPKRAMKE